MSVDQVESIFGETGFRYLCTKPHEEGGEWATAVSEDRGLIVRMGEVHEAEAHAQQV